MIDTIYQGAYTKHWFVGSRQRVPGEIVLGKYVTCNMAVNNNSILEYKCVICLQLLIEPVVLPCKHEMCRPCFRTNVEQANFVCPMCRRRISSWARKGIREGTLVDQNRWNLIQKLFPEKCLKRLQGNDDESEDECMYLV